MRSDHREEMASREVDAAVLLEARKARGETSLTGKLARRFEAVVFDWDGTAVPDRAADASRLRVLVEQLSEAGVHLAVVTGTHLGNVDGQLRARPDGTGRLYLCLNRGSEVYSVGTGGPELLFRREATPAEDAALDAAASATVAALAARGVTAEIVSQRLNRRKVDLIPEPEWADPPKARIGELLIAVEGRLRAAGVDDLREVVAIAEAAAREAGLPTPKVTSDAKHVEIGLTDKADSARWIFEELWQLGVNGSQVLVGGDEFGPLGGLPGSDSYLLPTAGSGREASAFSVGREPTGTPAGVVALGGGPPAFVGVLEDQLARRRARELPILADDEGWTVRLRGFDPELERVHGTLLTLADGMIGTSGSPVGSDMAARPRVLAAGLYAGDGAETELAPCPVWTHLDGELPPHVWLERRLDMRTGTLRQRIGREGELDALLFSSLAGPGTTVLRALGRREQLESTHPLETADAASDEGSVDGVEWTRELAGDGGVAVAARDELHDGALDRFASYIVDASSVPDPEAAVEQLAVARRRGFDRLLSDHRRAWAERWQTADIVIEGDDELQRLVRFSLFHLISSVAGDSEAAVGARGLTGPAYRGHVFWDSDVFVLPFLAATHPPAARAMLEYRLRRLDAARAIAADLGRRGVRFPWESAASGFDVTPSHAHDQAGRVVPIRTGELEEHIVADVAWAASFYVDWTDDAAFADGPARELLIETARYWASRIRTDTSGRAHIYGVIGPDEYHEPVDDNAFTNVMARWNLRRAAAVASGHVPIEELQRWRKLADALVDGYDSETRVYEQYAGFHRLEPLVIADLARRPIAADLLIGHERVAGAQVIKQADVLMLHHLVPEEVAPESLGPNLAHYEPRTAHGSSLSPAIHAALFARARRAAPALEALKLACRIDVDDLTGTTSGGLHIATMGGIWQALVFGFAGVRATESALTLDPWLPDAWNALGLNLSYRGRPVHITIEPDTLTVDADEDVVVLVHGRPGRRFLRADESWKEMRT
jgi:trehalose/maltose hydrolase-like predicted phosphorylase